MADGFRRLRINTQERAVSPDINRLQSFAHQEIAELFRNMLDVYPASVDDDLSTVIPATIETPLRAEIINGLQVKPQGGSLALLVDPGVLFAMAPDGSPDESNYKYLRDDGIAIIGSLTLTGNVSGSTRIDIIECSINPVDAIVTDSRDIFNATSGLFSAATVTKELRGRLQYRVTQGTPGLGMPARSAGWLPICVASVPTGTTSNDTITFWDVRPLVSDRVKGPMATPQTVPKLRQSQINATTPSTTAGLVEADLNGRRVGGRLRTGSTVADAQSIDFTAAANRDPSFALVAGQPWYIYLCTPFGLPRWARYTDGPANRAPRAPRGIPIASTVAPDANGLPSASIGLPTATGLGGSATTAEAFCISAGWADAVPAQKGFAGDSLSGFQLTLFSTGTIPSIAGGAFAGSRSSFVIPATKFPAHARELLLDFVGVVSISGGALAAGNYEFSTTVYLYANDGVSIISQEIIRGTNEVTWVSPGGFTTTVGYRSWIMLPTAYPSNVRPSMRVDIDWAQVAGPTAGNTWGNPAVRILGWRL